MAVVAKKEEKVEKIFELLGYECTLEEFTDKFKELYAKEWQKIVNAFEEHEKKDKKHKGHPMPHPDLYMKNMYNVGKKKLGK